MRRIAALQAGLVLVAMLANASSPKNTIRITVLDSATRASTPDNNNGVPKNCDQLTFDAYCRSTTNVPLVSTLLVQEGNEPPFRISCTIESRYSRCTPLPKGATFDARKEKRGITVYYVDDSGKARSQLYKLVDTDGRTGPPVPVAAVATQPVPATAGSAGQAPAAPVAATPQNSPAPASAPPAKSVQEVPREKVEKVKCSFTSMPSGAEITLDGKYAGSTPSEIPLSAGAHVVVFSLPGFAEWKRDLTVAAGSVVNVTANLQKMQ
jgi:hypothetical protein